uniref:ELMO domain-containing protein n=1 Tax=Compsopogon caeruleus TaxID=31354 RepID=A0A7S1THW9_9RHOD|mmetsp:Transcript_4879/g.9867  ORF Transcript_4879/g.9867 Transcript_4879/m.9867 type:complete len:316 (+) Transcript_4879:44-991(+)
MKIFERALDLLDRLWFICAKMTKWVVHRCTGASEIQRILVAEGDGSVSAGWSSSSSSSISSYRTEKLAKSITRSTKLDDVQSLLLSPEANSSELARTVAARKRIPPGLRGHLEQGLTNMIAVASAIREVREWKAKAVDRNLMSHREMLENLWILLKVGQEREGDDFWSSSSWSEIGFQGRDPCTDFRGAGVLGLIQLCYFAKHRPDSARRMLREPPMEAARYPFCCCGLNITASLSDLITQDKLSRWLYGKRASEVVSAFHDFYCDTFELFHARWVASKPQNILSFPPVFKAAMEQASRMLEHEGFITVDGREVQ